MQITIELEGAAARLVSEGEIAARPWQRAERCLDRYALILRRVVLPPFSEAEWALLLEAHAGTISEPAVVIDGFAAAVADAEMGWDLGRAHGVDARALIACLSGLDVAQTVALVERLETMRAAREEAQEREASKVVPFPQERVVRMAGEHAARRPG